MRNRTIIAMSTVIAGALGLALFLRPSHSIPPGPELAAPERIPPAARAVIRAKMRRHAEQLPALMSSAVVLDYDGVARAAGEIFDEPMLARPTSDEELNRLLPERFFVLQDKLRSEARLVVEAAARRNSAQLAQSFTGLTGTCVSCHDLYLHGEDAASAPPLDR